MQRRDFLNTLAAGAGLVIPLGRHAWAATAATPNADATGRKLIVVMLRGAVDGLNVVAPVADANYARLRPSIALAKPGDDNGALNLDGYFGLHPALAPLLPLWEQKKLAFVHASGSPDTTRSHFDAQDYMESATPGVKSTADGWMNRLVATLPGVATPTRALSIGPVMPRILSGHAAAVNLANGAAGTKANVLDRPAVSKAFDQLYADNARFGAAYQQGQDAHKEVMDAAAGKMVGGGMGGGGMSAEMQAANGGAPLPNGFPDDAARLAALMRNDPNIQLAFVALGGWDTHASQGAARGQLANRLQPLGQGLAVLAQRLGPLFEQTTIVVMSEFGRTARENGNGGTDHGHGNVMWVLGGGVNGGKVLGDWRGVGDAELNEGRDLPVTTDFRTVLAAIAERHLRLSDQQLVQVFPSLPRGGKLDLLRA
ncbi:MULTISPECIES: DUF1501 domain-containing protein [unclassified Duganella]|uniref:DUF1501 domain-containing protein n=1 Tax=unclassified Duganella TaxID=2636909 RepID=UPI000E34193F|nr:MULTISPECIES: DUF1501 domain-containing protein [unclassified Duganella]RFP15038.1 DUF1501 domain-containing protein [Duganella sp. BJB475]RFP31388.1 DUF1501 domain-containing protein [Duganella sp. BJB476]